MNKLEWLAARKPIFLERREKCRTCPTPCDHPPKVIILANQCPLPEPRWKAITPEQVGMDSDTTPEPKGLGDVIEGLAKPIAKALKLGCLDDKGHLKPDSGCGKRKALLNRMFPGNPT